MSDDTDAAGGLSIDNQTLADVIGDAIDTVTVYDRYRGIPVVEANGEYDLAVGEDGDLLVRVTPPEEYDGAVSGESDDDPITRSEYREEIQTLAETIEEEWAEYGYEDVSELVFEHVDGHQWVIYNHYAPQVLAHSDPEEWRHLVAEGERDHNKFLTAMAFDAMRSDVYEELRRRDNLDEV